MIVNSNINKVNVNDFSTIKVPETIAKVTKTSPKKVNPTTGSSNNNIKNKHNESAAVLELSDNQTNAISFEEDNSDIDYKEPLDTTTFEKTDLERTKLKVMFLSEKVKSGVALTGGELQFLDKNNQAVYQLAVDTTKAREEFLSKLAKCATKEDVMKLKLNNDNICLADLKVAENSGNSDEAFKLSAYKNSTQNAYDDYINLEEYKSLPFKL